MFLRKPVIAQMLIVLVALLDVLLTPLSAMAQQRPSQYRMVAEQSEETTHQPYPPQPQNHRNRNLIGGQLPKPRQLP